MPQPKGNKMKAPRTHLILLLDGSVSMYSSFTDMTRGVGALIESLRGIDNLTLDVVTFSDSVDYVLSNVKIDAVPEVMGIVYGRQCTALNAALHQAIENKIKRGLEMEEAVLVLLVSDGENGGSPYDLLNTDRYKDDKIARWVKENHLGCASLDPAPCMADLKTRIEQLRDSGQWTFTVFGEGELIRGSWRSMKPTFSKYGLDVDFYDYKPGEMAKLWDLIRDQIGDYMHARQGGSIPEHLKE